jgi:DNA-3-methyladenine glycosylase
VIREGEWLDPSWFGRDPVECARDLVGCRFRWGGCEGIIVETEAYAEHGDPACHTAFRPSTREFVKCHPAGTSYVYLNYGVHWLFNILTRGDSGAGFVLLRALEPVRGQAAMARRRGVREATRLCSGPGKLTQAMGITGSHHAKPFLNSCTRGICRAIPKGPVGEVRRIGISAGQDLPWRFLLAGSPHLSRPPEGAP